MKNRDVYDSIIALNDNFKRKGKTIPYTSANGYMFSLLDQEGEIGFRLPKDQQKSLFAFFADHGFAER